jgi:hypothetical protein
MDDKVKTLLWAIREAGAIFLAAVEDYLDVPYDKSVLAKRRAKVRQASG